MIKKLKSNDKKYGYNLTQGGEGTYGISRSGEKNPNYGKTHSDEVREKMSKNHYDCKGSNNPRAKKIYQFDKDGKFINSYSCAIDAEKVIGNRTNIRQAVRCKKIYNGYLWVSDKDVFIDNYGNKQIKNIFEFIIEKQIYKKIYQFDKEGNFIEMYNCSELAAEKYHCSNSTLNVAARMRKSSCGYLWRYEEDVMESKEAPGHFIMLENNSQKQIISLNDIDKIKENNCARPVICLNTRECFSSEEDASMIMNISASCIGACCRGNAFSAGKDKNGNKLVWAFMEDYKKMSEDDIKVKIFNVNKKHKRGKLLVNLTNNELFINAVVAAKYYNIQNPCSINECCRNKKGTIKKCKWLYYTDYLKENNLTDEEARKRLFFIEE